MPTKKRFSILQFFSVSSVSSVVVGLKHAD